MNNNNLWLVFSKFSDESRIDTIAAALETNLNHAKIIHNLITKNLQKQLAIKYATKLKYVGKIANKDQSNITNSDIANLRRAKKTSKLEKYINIHYFEIKQWRDNGISWLGVAKGLKQKYRIKISNVQVKNLYDKLQKIIEK